MLVDTTAAEIVSVGLKNKENYSGDDRSAAQLSLGVCINKYKLGKMKGERRVALLTDEGIE